MSTLPTTGATELVVAQASPETAVNEIARYLDAFVSRGIIEDRDLTAPPGSNGDGAAYLVAASPTGVWTGKAGKVAVSVGANASNGWLFVTVAVEGFQLYVRDENTEIQHNGAAWVTVASGSGDVVGPASSVDNHVAVFDSTTGKLLKDGGVALLANGANITPAAAPATTAVGYLGVPQNTQNGTYTTVMSDAGKHIYHTSGSAHTWTIDSNANVAYPIGTVLTFVNENGGGIVTLAITSDTLRWGSSTGSRSLAANGTCSALKVASTTWRLTGDGLS